MQTGTVITLSVATLLCTAGANAATCREELQQFERRLNESSLAVLDPEAFANLAREAEDAAEMRDEELCLQRAAELNAEIPAEDPAPPVRETNMQTGDESPERAPPEAPILLEAAPADLDAESVEQSGESRSSSPEATDDAYREPPGQNNGGTDGYLLASGWRFRSRSKGSTARGRAAKS